MNTLNNDTQYSFFATTQKGLELLLVDELKSFGASDAAEKLAGVRFSGNLALAYRSCLWSRLASRILLLLEQKEASDPDALYRAVQTIDWSEHLDVTKTLAVHFVCSQSNITHSLYGAQKVKDAIVDQFRAKFGERPSVARSCPDLQVYVYLHRNIAHIGIDLSGESLHKRGYRLEQGKAPLKETLAAAILLRAGWREVAKQGGSLLDPMCGSGTLLIEAAMMAGDIAPSLNRTYFGFLGWKKHQAKIWDDCLEDARIRKTQGSACIPKIVGYDHDAAAIQIAFANLSRAELLGIIHVEKRKLTDLKPLASWQPGLVVTNPPYGERLGELNELKPLYAELGQRLKTDFLNWRAAVLTANPELGKQMGLRAKRSYALLNGPIPCKLFLFDVLPEYFVDNRPERENERRIHFAQQDILVSELSPGIQMFINRLKKNIKHFARQARRQALEVYTVYDADLPEYAFLIELSADAAYVYEYPNHHANVAKQKKLEARRKEVWAVLPEALNRLPAKIYLKEVVDDDHDEI